jgi:hypothetical protein
MRGDITRDRYVSISDVTELQNIISGKAQAFYINADVS